MGQRKLRFIRCECGNDISARALARHLKSGRFSHSKEFVNKCIFLIGLAKKERYAWKIVDGPDGLRDDYWCAKVLNGELSLDEITFMPPRKLGENRSFVLKRISEERKGKGNPSLVNKPIYDTETIKQFAQLAFEDLLGDPEKFKKLDLVLNINFPDYRYGFAGMFPEHKGPRGHNRKNLILSILIDRDIKWIVSEKAIDRGKFIGQGQRKSPNFNKIQNAGRRGLKSYISIPHRTLYNMVLSVDKNAKMEKQLDYEETWKSYDIISPTKNILIEMHGRVWHDLNKCKPNMVPLVAENIENDLVKEKLAKDNGYKLFIFWDDQTDTWESRLEDVYGKRPKSYKQALCEEIDKKGKRRSL